MNKETSADVAAFAGELLNLSPDDLDNIAWHDRSVRDQLLDKIKAVAGSALAQRADGKGNSFVEKMSDGEIAVLHERQRQIHAEGWTPEHDDEHLPRRGRGEVGPLAEAATCYIYGNCGDNDLDWPWDMTWWKPRGYRRNLVKAAALLIAEIDRLDRVAVRLAGNEGGIGQ